MKPTPLEYLWPSRGIALRNPFDARLDHRGRVSHEAAAGDEISPIEGGEAHE
jgi:hypothetical protein